MGYDLWCIDNPQYYIHQLAPISGCAQYYPTEEAVFNEHSKIHQTAVNSSEHQHQYKLHYYNYYCLKEKVEREDRGKIHK